MREARVRKLVLRRMGFPGGAWKPENRETSTWPAQGRRRNLLSFRDVA